MRRRPHTFARLRPALATAALLVASGVLAAACGGGGSDESSAPTTGAEIYAAYCLTCHGADGQGGVGPQLAGLMETKYPNVDDQIAVVTAGRGTMPAWGSRLSPAQIRRVVEYTRTGLGQ